LSIIERSQYLDLDKSYLHMNYQLKPGMQEQSDYVIIGKEPWNYLMSIFNGTEIKRLTCGASDNRVEVNYRTVKILFVSASRLKLI
jgi:hypothetical protein